MAGEGGRRGEQVIEALAFRRVLCRGEWAAIALKGAADAAHGSLDLVAQVVAFFVDHMQAIAQEGIRVLNDEGFVVGAVDGPGAGGSVEQGSGGGRLRRGCWDGSCKRQETCAEKDAAFGSAMPRRGPPRGIIPGSG